MGPGRRTTPQEPTLGGRLVRWGRHLAWLAASGRGRHFLPERNAGRVPRSFRPSGAPLASPLRGSDTARRPGMRRRADPASASPAPSPAPKALGLFFPGAALGTLFARYNRAGMSPGGGPGSITRKSHYILAIPPEARPDSTPAGPFSLVHFGYAYRTEDVERNAGIAQMIAAKQSWSSIQAATGCSRATISKIAKRLKAAA